MQESVRLGNDQETVFGETHTIGVAEFDRWCESLHLSGCIAIVAVGHSPDGGLARADEQHVGGGGNRHVARIRHHGIQVNLETIRQLDLLQIGTNRIRILAFLGDGRNVHAGGGIAHALQRRQVAVLGMGQCCTQACDSQGERCQFDQFHNLPLCCWTTVFRRPEKWKSFAKD